MGLKKYRSKRDFAKTPEPGPIASDDKSPVLRFCVQKHAARRLHYDFRIEYKGVLVSWAVPKGPSLDPHDKRLAIKVEDHPLEYQYFEGTIPKGEYGAGTVEIWDNGTYVVPQENSPQKIEKIVSEGLKKGHLAIILDGEKLKGEFILQKINKDPSDSSWLMIKKEDVYVTNGKDEIIKSKKKKPMPDFISPMLAILVAEPFDGEEWLYEIKWDGYRALAFIDNEHVKLKSRSNKSMNTSFAPIVKELEQIQAQVILDGEIVILDKSGKSQFGLIQNYQKDKKGALYYYVFDFLYKDGADLRSLPLLERKKLLKTFLDEYSFKSVRYSDHILEKGKSFFKEIAKNGLEGMMAKKIESTYQSKRGPDWVKVKTTLRQDVVIGGFTAPQGSRKKFGALLVGVYDENGKLNYIGHVGGGFSDDLLNDVFGKLKRLIQSKCPFSKEPKPNAAVTWVKPTLVCEVTFQLWTHEHVMRAPIFLGLREDVPAKSVILEVPTTASKASGKQTKELVLTNLDKIYFPKEKYTKGDLIHYYEKIAPYILPYLKDRPITLYRFPEGITKEGFYQKDLVVHPPWIKTYPVASEGKTIHYLTIRDEKSLLFAVNLGSIDIHPSSSRIKHLDKPDYCFIDLDPHGITFDKVIEAALVTHEILSKLNVPHYCKTSGGKGLHIMIPLNAKYTFQQSTQFAEIICYLVHRRLPKTTSLERMTEKRPKKIYLDFLQNRSGATIVCPYSARPRPGALVSTPLTWSEVNENLDPKQFNIKTVPNRVQEKGDLLKGIFDEGINLNKVLNDLKSL